MIKYIYLILFQFYHIFTMHSLNKRKNSLRLVCIDLKYAWEFCRSSHGTEFEFLWVAMFADIYQLWYYHHLSWYIIDTYKLHSEAPVIMSWCELQISFYKYSRNAFFKYKQAVIMHTNTLLNLFHLSDAIILIIYLVQNRN